VPTPNALAQLHADYATLALRPPAALTPDRRRSLLFYRGELAIRARIPLPPQTLARVIQWLQTLIALEAFIAGESRWPCENRRLDRAAITAEERHLATWVRTQRTAANGGVRCDYQLRRLSSVPGFRPNPLAEQWHRHVTEYQHFTETWWRAPLLRSDDPTERRLAGFAAKQRLAYRRGRMSPHQIATLQRLDFWSWGFKTARCGLLKL
jgi:hypothetical protein